MRRDRKLRAIGLAFAGSVFGLGIVAAQTEGDSVPPVMPETVNIARGAVLYVENCASCHGTDLEGQADWRSPGADGVLPAPPHDARGHTWHHPDSVLFEYTTLGGRAVMARLGIEFNSGMPGFGDTLTDTEIWNVLAFIQSTWPERNQDVQAVRTEADLAQGDR